MWRGPCLDIAGGAQRIDGQSSICHLSSKNNGEFLINISFMAENNQILPNKDYLLLCAMQ